MPKKKKDSVPVCSITLPLRTELWQRDKLDKIFQCCNNLKNTLIHRKMNALKDMERTKRWKTIQSNLAELYPQKKDLEGKISKLQKNAEVSELTEEEKKQLKELQEQMKTLRQEMQPWFDARNAILKDYRFSKYQFEQDIQDVRWHYCQLIPSPTGQVLANDVWNAFDDYFFGSGKAVSFSSIFDLTYIRAKSNATGIRYQDDTLCIAGMKIPVIRSRKDPFGYEADMLSRDIRYCGISRKWYPEGWRYFAKLTVLGVPPVKVDPLTGELHHTVTVGRVGLDIGPQTLAAVGDSKVALVELAEGVQKIENELRRINRAMDRSRRATNPAFFNEDGTVIRIDLLPPECLTSRGKRKWKKSKHYFALESRRRYLYRSQADLRLQQHRALANELLSFGNFFFIEDMNWQALAKKAKEAKKSPTTGKNLRRKRFGKSIANKAPAAFVQCLKYKAEQMGGSLYKLNTKEAKASQYNHEDKAYHKKKLSKRWNDMPDGNKVQRDLYSAFLIQSTNDELNGFVQSELEKKYPNFLVLHDVLIQQLRRKENLPSSMGIRKATA